MVCHSADAGHAADTTPFAGQMKDVVTTGLGMIMFGDVLITAKNVTGVCIGLLGGMLYSIAKLL